LATHTFVHFDHEEAATLAQLESIRLDISSTVELCEFFAAQRAQSDHGYASSEITDAFSTAILVRYSRAFVSGVRRGLGEDSLQIFTSEQRAKHDHLRAFRDKHIAHSVNAFEDTRVRAQYCLERVEQEGITGVSAAHYRVVGLSPNDVSDILELCSVLLIYLDGEIQVEKVRLLKLIRAMPVADLLSRQSAQLLLPHNANVSKRRPRP
jgi:hypothetical protein